MIKVQKHSKEIAKIIQATRIRFAAKKQMNDFIQQVVSSVSPWRHFGEYPLNVKSLCCSVSAAPRAICVPKMNEGLTDLE